VNGEYETRQSPFQAHTLAPMRFSIALAFNSPDQWIELARAADEAGFDSVVVSDHLIYPEELKTPYPYTRNGQPRWERDTAWPDPMIATFSSRGAGHSISISRQSYLSAARRFRSRMATG